ncbi:Cullin-3 [Orbilia oligospora]|uniref:Cullin-3 n=2 Tax=Orbilia oligospora TaxID=2813651 RepID=A0A7C8NV08_ORBOL|nr:Cullin-3 [Orbilia oligospora]KAF3109932.1 Cullin-3 [Orbilia oligospora]KAF3117013.1 Cullin-3 [Orbilia oligospora]KAF3133281.1 Cullin-3 [Orbilia oligospora]KAF3153405.1 Cullin-3 [Orbilia oligospora]
MASKLGSSRIKIRAPRRGLANENMRFDDAWALLSEALKQIYERDASNLSFEELYRTAYKMVLKKHGDPLYNGVNDLVKTRLQRVTTTQLKPARPNFALTSSALERRESGNRFLAAVKQSWEDHQLCLGMITDILMYLDRVFCNDNKKPSIQVTGMALFRDNVLRNRDYDIGADLNRVILEQIRMERDGDVIDRARIRSCVYMLEGLYETLDEREDQKLYLTKFEAEFLTASNEFYTEEARKLLEVCDAATYIERTNDRLNEEWERTQSTISTLTEPKIRAIVEKHLITDNIREVMQLEASGLNFMVDNDRYEQLKVLYNLVWRVDNNVMEIRRMLKERVVYLGREINKGVYGFRKPAAPGEGPNGEAEDKSVNAETAMALRWVEDVLALKDKVDKIWEYSFSSDQGIQQTVSKSFAEFINENKRSPEYISLFVDENIKKGLKGKTEAEVDMVLDKAIVLFRYIQDKDIFERYYKKHLSKRLILGRSISNDVERAMIGKFKVEVGFSFTSKMEGMFKDMNVSQDLTAEYKKHLANLHLDNNPTIDLDIKVLTSTFWPWSSMSGETTHTCIYPPELEKIRSSFQQFYLRRHNGRQLTWQPQMGTADIRATFKSRKYEINVATYAMVVLLQFNDPNVESLSYDEIKTLTSIPESELVRHLQSLAVAPRSRVLVKTPMSRDVKPTDKFSFNVGFQSKQLKFKIGTVKGAGNKVETDKERKETEEKVDESRAHLIEAAVVRTMKARKSLKHADLMLQITEQLSKRFMPDPSMIKKRIESLIEREYLERETADPNTYVYLA